MLTTFNSQALIESPPADADPRIGSWEVADDLGLASRGFNLQAAEEGQFQPGSHVTITAGYDADRVTLIRGRVHAVDESTSPGEVRYAVSGQDLGIMEILGTPITFAGLEWQARPPSLTPRAHAIIRQAAAQVGVAVGSLGFPDYPLFASYVAHQRTLLDIVQDLIAPWNVFASIQHYPIVREDVLSVIRVDWSNPPSTGYATVRARQGSRRRQKRLYDDAPRLATVIELEVRGAAYTQPRPNLGVERTYNYVSRQVDREILESHAGTFDEFVWLEIYTLEEREDGKVKHTEEKHYRTLLTEAGHPDQAFLERIIVVDYNYFEPIQAIQKLVAFEPVTLKDALLWGTVEIHHTPYSFTVRDSPTSSHQEDAFGPTKRIFKQYFYNNAGEQYAEQESTLVFDPDSGINGTPSWIPSSCHLRTHTQTSSSTVRTQLTVYSVNADVAQDQPGRLTPDFDDSQQVGGRLTTTNSLAGREDVMSVQARFPPLDLINGVPTERHRSSNAWSYENPYLGLAEVTQIYNGALAEQALQIVGPHWDSVDFESTLDPNLWAGQPLHVEINEGEFIDFWCESVKHRYDINGARTIGVARRLTTGLAAVVVIVTVAAPTNLVATAISSTEIDLTWTDNATNETDYRVEQSPDGLTGWVEITILPANSTSYNVTGLSPSTIYYFRVRAFALI